MDKVATPVTVPKRSVRKLAVFIGIVCFTGGALMTGIVLDWYPPRIVPLLCGAMLSAAIIGIAWRRAICDHAEASCPTCNGLITGLDWQGRNDDVLCRRCNTFLEGRRGMLWAIEKSDVADEPRYGVRLVPEFQWPCGCVVCGKVATRSILLELDRLNDDWICRRRYQAAHATSTGFASRSGDYVMVKVPHCSQHEDGAWLEPAGHGETNIVFRSLAFQRAFRKINGLNPCARVSSRAISEPPPPMPRRPSLQPV